MFAHPAPRRKENRPTSRPKHNTPPPYLHSSQANRQAKAPERYAKLMNCKKKTQRLLGLFPREGKTREVLGSEEERRRLQRPRKGKAQDAHDPDGGSVQQSPPPRKLGRSQQPLVRRDGRLFLRTSFEKHRDPKEEQLQLRRCHQQMLFSD